MLIDILDRLILEFIVERFSLFGLGHSHTLLSLAHLFTMMLYLLCYPSLFFLSTFYANTKGTKTLTKRVHYLIAGQRKKKTSKILLSLAFIIPLLSNSIIFEAWYTETENTEGTYSEEEFKSKSYIIDHGDGTYDLYLDGQAFPIESPDRPEFEGIKIFKE